MLPDRLDKGRGHRLAIAACLTEEQGKGALGDSQLVEALLEEAESPYIARVAP
jgi:hypothetical protein